MDGPTCDPAANPVLIVVADQTDFYYQEYGDTQSGMDGFDFQSNDGSGASGSDGVGDSIWVDTGNPTDSQPARNQTDFDFIKERAAGSPDTGDGITDPDTGDGDGAFWLA